MDRTEEYKGHTIAAWTFKLGHGWQWSYSIDAGPIRSGRDRPLDNEEIMLDEAMRHAKSEIDNMG